MFLLGCSTTQPPVPIVDRIKNTAPEYVKPSESSAPDHQVYTVRKGDTLYGIAINHGVDYKKLTEWNDIVDPNSIVPGQKIRLIKPVVAESKPTLYALPQQPITASIEPDSPLTEPPQIDYPENNRDRVAGSDKVKTSPKALKLPYSEQNAARLQDPGANLSATQPMPSPASVVPEDNSAKLEVARQTEPSGLEQSAVQATGDWIWPTNGKVLSHFSKNSKGVKIAGQPGQPVVASAAGVVVYSGSGLRGYGNLIIIKHDDTFLTAYAHNNKLLVKEGEAVVKGQKIAEMGNTDSDTVQLHFEIRKNSKPVDPLEYLPNQS